jgi:hypothetical protein
MNAGAKEIKSMKAGAKERKGIKTKLMTYF